MKASNDSYLASGYCNISMLSVSVFYPWEDTNDKSPKHWLVYVVGKVTTWLPSQGSSVLRSLRVDLGIYMYRWEFSNQQKSVINIFRSMTSSY